MQSDSRECFLHEITKGVPCSLQVMSCEMPSSLLNLGSGLEEQPEMRSQLILRRDCLWWVKEDYELLADEDDQDILLSRNSSPTAKQPMRLLVDERVLISLHGKPTSLDSIKTHCSISRIPVALLRVTPVHLMIDSSFENLQSILKLNSLKKDQLLRNVTVSVKSPVPDRRDIHKSAELILRCWRAAIDSLSKLDSSTGGVSSCTHKCGPFFAALSRSFSIQFSSLRFWSRPLIGVGYSYFLLACFESITESTIV